MSLAMLKEELSNEYLENIESHLRELRYQRGVLLSAQDIRIGKGRVQE